MQRSIEDFHLFDKRRILRFKVHYLTDIFLGNEIIYSTVLDISESGIGITCPHRLRPEEELKLRINCSLPSKGSAGSRKIDIPFSAKVVWIREEQEKRTYRAGLAITGISADSLENLRAHIERLMSLAGESVKA